MAQIDLLNLLKATSAPGTKGAGSNLAVKSSVAGMFEQILSGQKDGATPAILGGNSVPSGNSLPTEGMSMLQQAQTSQQLLATISPQQQSQIDDVSFITQLQPLVDMPQTPIAGAVSQLGQFTDTQIDFSDQQLQTLAVQLGIDPAVAKLVLQSTVKPQTAAGSSNVQVSSHLGIGFKPGQVQTTVAMGTPDIGAPGIDTTNVVLPAAAKVLLQSQSQGQLQPQGQLQLQAQGQPKVQSQVQNQGQPQVQAQGQPQIQAQGQPKAQAQVQTQGQPKVQPQAQAQVQAQGQPQIQAQVQTQVQPQAQAQAQVQTQLQIQTQTQTQTQTLVPPQGQPQLQPQPNMAAKAPAPSAQSMGALPLNDTDVIKVRSQTSPVAVNNTVSSAASAGVTPAVMAATPQIAAQSFLQQRQSRVVSPDSEKKTGLANTINKVLTQNKGQVQSAANANANASASAGATSAATTNASITFAPSLVQKLDQFTGLTLSATNTTNPLESNTLGSYTGANFKAAAPLASLPASVSVGSTPAIDAPTMDLGQRFTNLLQGDSSAQLGARQMQDQIGQQLQRMVKEGRWQANLSLNPARLGQVNINLVMEDGVLQTQLLSSNAGVRELLESSLPRLRDQLEGSGLQLADVSVGDDTRGQQQTRGEEPDWQLSQTVKNVNEEQVPVAASHRSNHDGDVDTFA